MVKVSMPPVPVVVPVGIMTCADVFAKAGKALSQLPCDLRPRTLFARCARSKTVLLLARCCYSAGLSHKIRVDRPSYTGCLYDGCPNEEKRGPVPSKFGAPFGMRIPPKPTPPPRLPTPCVTTPPPRNAPPWKPAPPRVTTLPPNPPPPPDPPSPPPPWPAAHPALARAIDVMPTKLSSFNFFTLQDRDSSVSRPLRVSGV